MSGFSGARDQEISAQTHSGHVHQWESQEDKENQHDAGRFDEIAAGLASAISIGSGGALGGDFLHCSHHVLVFWMGLCLAADSQVVCYLGQVVRLSLI